MVERLAPRAHDGSKGPTFGADAQFFVMAGIRERPAITKLPERAIMPDSHVISGSERADAGVGGLMRLRFHGCAY